MLTTTKPYRSWTEVNLGAFRHNFHQIKKLINGRANILQVVKADAYGHGAVEIASNALSCGATMLGVANADEGAQLRIGGISAPIVILSPSDEGEIPEIQLHSLIPSVSLFSFAQELSRRGKKSQSILPLHIEVDTGMGRGGIMCQEGLKVIKKIAALPNVFIEGIFTHLAVSETPDACNEEQFRLFNELVYALEKEGIIIPLKHIANSGAILNFPNFSLNLVRPGLMSYGVYPDESLKGKVKLQPVLSFKTLIILLKAFPAGSSIGYGRTFITKKKTTIATIPVGYADGLPRLLSNCGEVLVQGRRCPLVGRISMDMCTIDVSRLPQCAVGDEVVLLGSQGRASIDAEEIARHARTIGYEILCSLGKRAPRIFVKNGKTASVEPRLRRMFIPDEEKSLSRISKIIRQSLQVRTKSVEVGDAIYSEVLEMLFGRDDTPLELRENLRYRIKLSEFGKAELVNNASLKNFYKVTIKIEYQKSFSGSRFMVGCAQNSEQLKALFQEKSCEYRWLLDQPQGEITPQDFRLTRARVGGQEALVTSVKKNSRGLEVWCQVAEVQPPKQTRLALEIITRKRKDANTFSVFLVYPTRGVEVTFDYSQTDITNPKEVCFFAGKSLYPNVNHQEGKRIEVAISEWVFPNSGITFTW
ncbi:MAG: alanine racemase [Deltaproteobacteria bacterium]|nr:alanine racemase [Deltaproteobacteria bacterium]